MHIDTLKKIRTNDDIVKLRNSVEQVSKDMNIPFKDLLKVDGLPLNCAEYIYSFFDAKENVITGHILFDIKSELAGLFFYDLKSNSIKQFTDYKYKNFGITGDNLIICCRPDDNKDLFFEDEIIVDNIEDLAITNLGCFLFIIVEFPEFHSLLCIDRVKSDCYVPKDMTDFMLWFNTHLAMHSMDRSFDNEVYSDIASFPTIIKEDVFDIPGYKRIELM